MSFITNKNVIFVSLQVISKVYLGLYFVDNIDGHKSLELNGQNFLVKRMELDLYQKGITSPDDSTSLLSGSEFSFGEV